MMEPSDFDAAGPIHAAPARAPWWTLPITLTVWAIGPVLGFLLPSRVSHVNIFRIFVVGIGLTALFLFAARYWIPGGASQFLQWAEALVSGSTLSPTIAQRDVGFPLLLLLSGYTITGSLIGITLIHALFAILMPVLLYIAVRPFGMGTAYYAGQVGNLCLGPFLFVKVIHHDQTYIFFMILSIVWLIVFFNRSLYKYLYLFTVACLAASITRPAGNLLFPVFLAIAFVFTPRPRRIWHYASCAIIFIAVNGLYQWHRYEIFDIHSQPNAPSYVGEQIFYNLYINSAEFGITLSPNIGPSIQQMDTDLRSSLTAAPRSSKLLQDYISLVPKSFAESEFLPFTREQLMRRIYSLPNWEYYNLLCAAEPNDQIMLGAAFDIAKTYPVYALRYSLRNLIVFLFHPGYAHTRYDVVPFHPIGMNFYPTSGRVYETANIAEGAIREAQLDPLSVEPRFVSRLLARALSKASINWQKYYQGFVSGTMVLMLVAWLALAWATICAIGRRFRGSGTRGCQPVSQWSQRNFLAALLSATMLLLYNAAVTAAFVEPDYRYHDFMLLVRVLVSAFGIIVLAGLIRPRITADRASRGAYSVLCAIGHQVRRGVDFVHAHDVVEIWAAKQAATATYILVFAVAVLFVTWGGFMRAYSG